MAPKEHFGEHFQALPDDEATLICSAQNPPLPEGIESRLLSTEQVYLALHHYRASSSCSAREYCICTISKPQSLSDKVHIVQQLNLDISLADFAFAGFEGTKLFFENNQPNAIINPYLYQDENKTVLFVEIQASDTYLTNLKILNNSSKFQIKTCHIYLNNDVLLSESYKALGRSILGEGNLMDQKNYNAFRTFPSREDINSKPDPVNHSNYFFRLETIEPPQDMLPYEFSLVTNHNGDTTAKSQLSKDASTTKGEMNFESPQKCLQVKEENIIGQYCKKCNGLLDETRDSSLQSTPLSSPSEKEIGQKQEQVKSEAFQIKENGQAKEGFEESNRKIAFEKENIFNKENKKEGIFKFNEDEKDCPDKGFKSVKILQNYEDKSEPRDSEHHLTQVCAKEVMTNLHKNVVESLSNFESVEKYSVTKGELIKALSTHHTKLKFLIRSEEPAGLKNHKNTCYMNASLQCLKSTPLFVDYFLQGRHKIQSQNASNGLSEMFGEFLERMLLPKKSGDDMDISDYTLLIKSLIAERNSIFEGNKQHDVLEFIKNFLEGISQEQNRVVKKKDYYKSLKAVDNVDNIQTISNEWFENMLQQENSIITDLFCGQILNKTKCNNCKNTMISFDTCWDLSLGFKQAGKSFHTLQKLLNDFLSEETVNDVGCKSCGLESSKATVNSLIWRLPEILIIHFKRFRNFNGKNQKINDEIFFPVKKLDMGEYVKSDDDSCKDLHYSLFALINHYGELGSGHYTSECLNSKDQTWYYFDDNTVTKSKIKSDTEFWKSAPYILFYARSSHLGMSED